MKLIILAIVQGLSEFLPVSSSGHLVFVGKLLFLQGDAGHVQYVNVLLHLGTLCAIVFFFRVDLYKSLRVLGALWSRSEYLSEQDREYRDIWVLVAVASVPTACLGLALKSVVVAVNGNLIVVSGGFFLSALVLYASKYARVRYMGCSGFAAWNALILGVAQGLAVFPGVSRSGMTISVALLLGLERQKAGVFSFFLAIPTISGAVCLEFLHLYKEDAVGFLHAFDLFAACVAGLCGYGILGPLLRIVRARKLFYFAFYCFFMAALLLFSAFLLR